MGRAWAYLVAMEPARVVALVRAVLVLAGVIGLSISEGFDDALVGVIIAVYALVEAGTTAATRARVVPAGKLPESIVDRAALGPPLPGSKAAAIRDHH